MNNEIIINGKMYKLESIWKKNEKDNSKDSKGNPFIFPKIGSKWSGQQHFIDRLIEVQEFLINNNKSSDLFEKNSCSDCLLCKEKCVVSGRFVLGRYIWDDGLVHYISKHNIKPTEKFIDKIFNYEIKSDAPLKLTGRIKNKKDTTYLKLKKNQIMILDALMIHGGYDKKYYDSIEQNTARYSEHAGFIDIENKLVQNIIVSGNTLRVDTGDEEIFLPISTHQTYQYEYIFHTHPPTPKPGGRVKDGILYEFPSIGDILHFIDHHNDGHVVGSLVMTAEGMYNIRKLPGSAKKIKIDEDKLYDEMRKIFKQTQTDAIKEYGSNFNTFTFYSKISQDTKYIDIINKNLKKFGLIIDFYPRNKDLNGKWVVDSIYVPLT